jgi:hypothetical protein
MGVPGQLFGLRRMLELDGKRRDSRFILVRALDGDREITLRPVGVSLCVGLIMLCCLLLQGCPRPLFISVEKAVVRLQSWLDPKKVSEVTFHRNSASLAYSTRIRCSRRRTSPCFCPWARPGPTTRSHIAAEPCGSCIDKNKIMIGELLHDDWLINF